jgi:hypothetical protein
MDASTIATAAPAIRHFMAGSLHRIVRARSIRRETTGVNRGRSVA